jgi:hypothetical protein
MNDLTFVVQGILMSLMFFSISYGTPVYPKQASQKFDEHEVNFGGLLGALSLIVFMIVRMTRGEQIWMPVTTTGAALFGLAALALLLCALLRFYNFYYPPQQQAHSNSQ